MEPRPEPTGRAPEPRHAPRLAPDPARAHVEGAAAVLVGAVAAAFDLDENAAAAAFDLDVAAAAPGRGSVSRRRGSRLHLRR